MDCHWVYTFIWGPRLYIEVYGFIYCLAEFGLGGDMFLFHHLPVISELGGGLKEGVEVSAKTSRSHRLWGTL